MSTSPVPATPHIMPSPRYSLIAGQLAQTAFEQLTCGCHLHISVGSEDEGVGVLDRIRAWLPVLLVLSANSPFWNGHDTGYASYRHHLSSVVGTGVPVDSKMIYFDARLGWDSSTVVIQVADVCMDSEGPVLLAALARARVETAAVQWSAGDALAKSGDEQWVATVLDQLLHDGGGARHQRADFSVTGMPVEVVAEAIFRTHRVEAVRPPVRVSP